MHHALVSAHLDRDDDHMGITGAQRAGCAMQARSASDAGATVSTRTGEGSRPAAVRGVAARGGAIEHPLLAGARQALESVAIGRESLAQLEAMGASVEVLPDDEYARVVGGGSIGNTLTRLADGSVTAKIRLRESALRDPKLGAALLAHEIEHGYRKYEARSLAPGTEADAERREAAVKVALGVDPVAGNS